MTQLANGWIVVDTHEYVKENADGSYLVYLDIKDSIDRGTVYSARVNVPDYAEGKAEEVAVGLLKDAIKQRFTHMYREFRYESQKHLVEILIEYVNSLS